MAGVAIVDAGWCTSLQHPRPREVCAGLAASREDLMAALHAANLFERAHSALVGWSVAEIAEHLLLIEGPLERFLSSTWIAEAIAGVLAQERDTSPVVTMVEPELRTIAPDRHARTFEPSGTTSLGWVIGELQATRTRLLRTLVRADGLAWGDAYLTMPGFGRTRVSVYAWLVWVGRHEACHAAHIRRLSTERAGAERSSMMPLQWPECACLQPPQPEAQHPGRRGKRRPR